GLRLVDMDDLFANAYIDFAVRGDGFERLLAHLDSPAAIDGPKPGAMHQSEALEERGPLRPGYFAHAHGSASDGKGSRHTRPSMAAATSCAASSIMKWPQSSARPPTFRAHRRHTASGSK